jgi:hypothetical protein
MSTRIVQLAFAALTVFAAGCAGARSDQAGTSTMAGALPSASAVDLAGTWRGSFSEVGASSGLVHGNIEYAIGNDGTYTTTWVTHMAAGSSRGGRREMSGRVAARGNRVMFTDASGAQMVLTRQGNTLYGVALDPAGKRATVSIELRKIPEAP